MSNYIVEFNGLGEGRNTFEYDLNNDFFAALEQSEIHGGEVKAEVTLRAKSDGYKVGWKMRGEVFVSCDRCTADMPMPVEAEAEYDIVFSNTADDTDTLIVLEEDSLAIDLSWYLYESVLLSLPFIRKHEDDSECDEDMREALDKYLATGGDEDEE